MSTRSTSKTAKQDRRQFASTAALGLAVAGASGLLPSIGKAATSSEAIRPFRVSDDGAPGLRPHGPHFYSCYVRDPDGNKLSAVCEKAEVNPE